MKISKLMNGVAATALSSVLALGQMGAAQADETSGMQAGFNQQQTELSATSGSTAASLETKSRRDAYGASLGKIVLFVGSDIKAADAAVLAFKMDGYDAIAFSGGANGQIEVFVDRQIVPTKFSQRDLFDGTVNDTAAHHYNMRFGRPAVPAATASL